MVLLRYSSKNVNTIFFDFNLILVPQFAQVTLHLLVEDTQLLVKVFLLAESPLVHADLVAQLVVLELVLVRLSPNFFLALGPQFAELTLLGIF